MKNLPRWIFSSVAEHFRVIAADNNIPYFVEGLDERSEEDMQISHSELRVTGPAVKEVSKGYYHVEAVINFMLTSMMDMTGNAYELVQWGGILQEEMLEPIPVYKYGTGPKDTGQLLGCLRVKGDQRNKVQLYHFGQVSMVDRVRQSELDAVYELWTSDAELELGDAIPEGGPDPHDPLIALPPSNVMSMSDSVVIASIGHRFFLGHTLNLSSTADVEKHLEQSVLDAMPLSSATGMIADWVRPVDDPMTMSDDTAVEQDYDFAFTDLGLAQDVFAPMTRPRDLTQNAGITDDVTATLNTPAFTFTINTEQTGTSNSQQFELPLELLGSYNFTVEWGDGDQDTITSYSDTDKLHTYASSGNYEVKIKQECIGWRFNNGGDSYKMVNISEWGPVQFRFTGGAFYGCRYMDVTATDTPTFNGSSMRDFFNGCRALTNPNFSNWDTSNITSFRGAFSSCILFTGNVSTWNTHNATTMYQMFAGCDAFNPPTLDFNTHNVATFYQMFGYCDTFNTDVSSWNTHNATEFTSMFRGCINFNRDLTWNTVNATDIDSVFNDATSFNGDVTSWNTVNVVDMQDIFRGATLFNRDVSSWNTHNCSRFDFAFYNATSFDQDLSSWNTNNGTRFYYMFNNSSASFNCGGWDISSLTNAQLMWNNSDLDTANYDALLIGWNSGAFLNSVLLDVGNVQYTGGGAAEAARNDFTGNHSWTITDGGTV